MFHVLVQEGRRWLRLGGSYGNRKEAEEAVERFRVAGTKKSPRRYRIAKAA